jgi:pseudouridine-5'-phosphate glycosidase
VRLEVSKTVKAALKKGRPVVALETSVLAQGLAWPRNLEAAKRCGEAISRSGATAAAIAVLDGKIHVGLSDPQVLALCRPGGHLLKLGARDLAPAIARGASGGTTVSATCEIAAAAGIRIFATGGIGGVHRGVLEQFDISSDLTAISRSPVAVICAGAKVVLDLPRTLEALETLGVPVVGYRTDALPGFYIRSTGLPLEHRVDDAKTAAQMLQVRFAVLKQGGVVIAVPPPAASAMQRADVERYLKAALAIARQRRVWGKAVTPFLLGELARRSKGHSVKANLDLLENNAAVAAEIAVELAKQ